MLNVPRLIQLVRSQPMLYNRNHADYKDIRQKEKIWKHIATELKSTVDIVKKKWKNLRDSYAKCLKSLLNGDNKKNYNRWQWAPMMEHFRPFIGIGSELGNDCNITDLYLEFQAECSQQGSDDSGANSSSVNSVSAQDLYENDNDGASVEPDDADDEGEVKSESSNRTKSKQTKQTSKESQLVQQNVPHIQIIEEDAPPSQNHKRKFYENMDAVEHIFLGYAMTVKQFSPKRQAVTKLRIAEILMEQEIAHQEETQKA